MANAGGVDLKAVIAKLKLAGVKIPPLIWDTMYLYLADYLSVINLCCGLYIEKNEPIGLVDGTKLQNYTRKSAHIIHMILHPEEIETNEPQLGSIKSEALKLNVDFKELIRHFVHNDLHVMGMAIDDSLDPIGPEPIPIKRAINIFERSASIISVLEELRNELQDKEIGF